MENLDLGINLGFGETSSVDNLIDKVNVLEKSIVNINEVSNLDMFTNALKSFQELKSELKDIKSLLNEDNQGKEKSSATNSGKNPYKSETFSLSQTLLNIEKLLTEINSTSKKQSFNNEKYGRGNSGKGSKGNDNSNDNPFRKVANDELRKYYHSQEKTYKDKKLELDKVSKMTTKQFEDGFSKIVKGISKDVVDILDRDLLKKMVEKNATEMLKNGKYTTKDNLDERYKEISQLIKNAGFNSNMFKSSPIFRKEYNEKLYEIEYNKKIQELKRTEVELKMKGIHRNSNTDTMTGRQLEKLLEDNRRIYNIINSKHFQNFGDGQVFKSTEDKLNRYINQMNDNKIKGQNIKENGLSLQNTIQQNSSTMIAGIEAFKYLGSISNFITSKDFERNMGALGIVGNLGNQASQNASKNRIIRESNSVGADINEFAEGVREVIKTGKTYEQSMNLVKTAGKVAVASFEDLTTATNILNQRFTALGISATDKNLNEFANRLQSALDNTALDLQDVNNAGRQTNTAMNALINSAEEKGIQGRSVEKYTMDVSNLELSLLSTLKQQGKTGEQSGIVLRTLFSKLMSVDGKGKAMLENDFKKMTKDEREKVGFGSVEEMTDMVLSGEVDKVIEGLSKMQKQGNLSYATIKKIFTERHASAISTLFTEVNGDTKKFIDNITTGINVSKNFGKAIENWAVKVERIFKNLKSISTNTFSRGIFGGALGVGVGITDKITDLIVKGQSSDNVLLSSFSQGLPQAMAQRFMFKNINDFTQGKAYQKVESAYDLSIERIKKDKSLGSDRRKEILNQVELLKNQDLEKLINNKGISGFASQVKGATSNVYDLSNKIKESVYDIDNLGEEGIKSFSALSGGAKGLGTALWAFTKPLLILTTINMAINTVIGLFEKAQKLKNEADNLDKEIINISKIGSDIETIEKSINDIFDPKNYQDEEENGYIKNVRKMVEANDELKSSIDNINAIKNNPFKDIQTIRDEIWKEKTKNSLINSNNYSTQGRLGISDRRTYGEARYNQFTYGNTSRISIGEWNDEYDRNYRIKYRGEKFNNISVIDKENEDRISKLNETERHKELNKYKKMYNNNYVKSTDKAINNLYDDVYAKFKKELKNKGLDEKSVSDEDKQKYLVSNLRISNELVSNVFGKKSSEALNGKDVTDTESFYKLLNSLGGKNLQDNIKIFNDLISSGKIEPETLSLLTQYSNYQLNVIKEADDLFYKQLERNKESLEQSKSMLEGLKNKMVSMYDKTGLSSIAYGKILNEEKDEKGNLRTLSQQELDKYNTAYNNDINSVPMEMSMNNIEGVRDYQSSMLVYYTKKAGLDKEIQDTQKNIEEAKKQGNLQEQQQLEAKLNWLNQDVKFLDQSKEMAKKVLHFSNFTAKKYDELLSMSAEIAKAQSVYRNMIGTSFGNQGSQMQTAYDSLNASRNLFNKVGKMNFNNQVNSAYIEDKDGAILQKITGKNDYSKVNMNDYVKLMDRIKDYRKNNISEKDGVNIETLQNQATVYSSIISERMNIQQQEIQLAQQEKQIHIDIVKYWLNEQKLKTEFVESGEIYTNENKQSSLPLVRKMTSGENELYRMNDLQELTNLKLENSNLRMKDQLDYARRQIAVAKENAQRQINAIRRLEGTSSTNSRKSDSVAKSNTNVTNKTIVDSANSISNNLVNALNSMMESMSSFGGGDVEGGNGGTSSMTGGTNAGINFKSMSNGTSKKDVLRIIKEAQMAVGGDYTLGVVISAGESDFKNTAKGNGTTATGIFQFLRSEKNEQIKHWGHKHGINAGNYNLLDNRQSSLLFFERMKDAYNLAMKRGYTPTRGDLYLSHFYPRAYDYITRGKGNMLARKIFDAEALAKNNFVPNGTLNQLSEFMWQKAMRNAKSQGVLGMLGDTSSVISYSKPQKVNAQLVNTSSNVNYGRDTAMVISGAKGLKVKSAETTAGGKITQSTYDFAKLVQSNIKGFERFTAFNDSYHKNHSPNSLHTKGMKFDFTIKGGTNASNNAINQLYTLAKQHGFDIKVLNEYTNPSGKATGGHLDVKVNGRKAGSVGTTLNVNFNMPEEYIPNMSESTEKLIREITNNDFTKDMIKSQAEEEASTSIAMKYKELFDNSDDHVKSREMFNNWWNDYVLSHQNVDLSVSKDIARSVLDREKTLLDTARDTYDKIVSQFIENVKALNYSFEEMQLNVKDVNTEWERNYNFLTRSKLSDTLYDFTKSIETNKVKISSLTRQLAKDIEINPSVTSLFKYLEDNLGIKLETQEDRYNFMSNNDKLLPLAKMLEENMFDLAKEQFKNLGMDKFAFQELSKEEKQEWLNKAYTSLKKQGETSEDIFQKSQNFDNQTTMYKRLTEQMERNNEIHRAEAENFKIFGKSIEDLSSGIKELSDKMFNLESIRNLNTVLEEVKLLNKGIDLDSVYGKRQMMYIKAENSRKQLEESRQSVRTLLKASPMTISALEMAGFNRDSLKNLDLNNFKNIQKLIEGIKGFTETQDRVAKEQFNKFLDDNPQLEKYRSVNIFDKEALKELKNQILEDDSVDNNKALELVNFLDNIENGFVKFDDIVNSLQKLVTVIKDSNTQFIEMFKQFSSKSVDMLSSILFGTDFEWKGLDYKEALNNLFGLLTGDSKNIKRSFKKFFNIPQKDDNENVIEQDYSISNRPSSLKMKNRAYIGENDFRTLLLNKIDKFDLNNEKQDNIYLDEEGNISRVYNLKDDFSNDLINMLKSNMVNKVNINGEDFLPELQEDGRINLYRIKTNQEKTKVWLENAFTFTKKYERDVKGSLEDTIKSINLEVTSFNKTSRDKIGEDKLQSVIGIEGISTLNTPNYTEYFNQELKVIDSFEKENDRFRRENEKNLINSSDKISKILQYNSDEVNKEKNKKNINDLLYMYERLQKPIGEGNGISFKTDKNNSLVYKILSQAEKNIEVGTPNEIRKNKLDNGISFTVNGKEVYKLLTETASKKVKTGKRKSTIVDFTRVYLLDSNNKRTNLKDFTKKDNKAFYKYFTNKGNEIMDNLKKEYPNTKTTKKVTETELEPYYNVKTNTFYNDDYKSKNRIKIQYSGNKEQANNLYYTQNTESTNKYVDPTKNYGLNNSLFVQNIEDLKTLAGLINPNKLTSYQKASKGMVSKNTSINDSKDNVSGGKKRVTVDIGEDKKSINYFVDGNKIGTLGYEHPTITTTTGKGKKKKIITKTDESKWQTYFINEKGKKTVYDKGLPSEKEAENLVEQMMKTKDEEFFRKYDMDNPTPKVDNSVSSNNNTSNSNFSKEYVDMLKRYEAFNEYVNSKEFIDILKDRREDKETQIKKINAWTKSFEILGDKNAKFTALQTIYESSWQPFEKSRIARGYNFGGLTTPTKWGIEDKSTIGKDGQGHAVFRDMGTGIAGRLIYGYTEKAYKDLMYKGGNFSNFYENYYGKYVGHDLPTYVKDLTNMGKTAGINFKDNRVPSEKGKNPFDLIPLTHSKKGFKDVDETKIFEDLKKYREQTGDYSKFDIENIKNLQSYTKQYNDSVMMATSILKGAIIDTSKKQYLSASGDVISDMGDTAIQQYVQDNKKNLTTDKEKNLSSNIVEENQQPMEKVEVVEIKQPQQDIQNYGENFVELVRQEEIKRLKMEKEKKNQEREQNFQKSFAYVTTIVTVIDGMLKKELNYKKKQLEIQQKVLELNLQMAETTEERRKIEEQILQNKLSQIDNEYKTQSSFMGGMISGSIGFGIQGALSGAMQGSNFGLTGSLIGAGLGLVGGILGGTQAKIQADQQKSLQISQQKLTWLAEDRNRYLKTMANAMSEQAKWTTRVGVNDAISRSVRFALSGKDVIGGTAYETRTVSNKKKKGGGLLGSKKYDTVEAFTQSYNLNDSMFGGRQFNNKMDLEFAYTTLAQKLLGMQSNINLMGTYGDMYYYNNPEQTIFGRFARNGRKQQRMMSLPMDSSLNDYLQRRLNGSSRELTASEFIKYFNGQGTLQGDGLLIDRSRDNEIDNLINNLKETAKAMPTGQQKVDTLALINFYENIKAVLDKEGKTTKRLFGNYYNIETEEVKDEKGNITEYRRVNESMWSDYYNQIYQNVMNGTKVFDTGSKFIQGTLNAFIQNVGSGRNTVKALTDEFNRLADEIYDVVTRTGEFSNVSGSIKGLIDNMALLKKQQRETENFTIDLAKRWVALGGNITDIVKDMNNGLTTAIDSIKSTMLGASLEDTINNFGNNLFQKLGESMTTNLINQKYANSIFKMNSLLTNATDTNSISDIVNLANGYKGLSAKIESDRERLGAIQRLFTANRDIDYVDESIQYETGTSQSVTNNYTFTTDINAGTIVADELSKEILAQNLFAPLVQMLKDSGFIH